MAIIAKDKGSGEGFEPVPAGTHIARCISVVDIGPQDTPWGAKEKVYIGFEVPGVNVEWKDKEGNEHSGPAMIGKTYTNSLNEKSWLGQHLESWRGKPFTEAERNGFDLMNILGAPCMISVTHEESKNGKTYAAIKAIMKLPAGTNCPDASTDLLAYSPNDPELIGNFEKLPAWLQERARAGYGPAADSLGADTGSQEMPDSGPPTPPVESYSDEAGFEDDLPF